MKEDETNLLSDVPVAIGVEIIKINCIFGLYISKLVQLVWIYCKMQKKNSNLEMWWFLKKYHILGDPSPKRLHISVQSTVLI